MADDLIPEETLNKLFSEWEKVSKENRKTMWESGFQAGLNKGYCDGYSKGYEAGVKFGKFMEGVNDG